MRRVGRILASILPVMEWSEMPVVFAGLTLRLYRCMIEASLNSSRIVSCCHMSINSWWSFSVRAVHPPCRPQSGMNLSQELCHRREDEWLSGSLVELVGHLVLGLGQAIGGFIGTSVQ